MVYEEFENDYTIAYYNGKLFVSNQKVTRTNGTPYYATEAYKATIDSSGKFEFMVNEEDARVIIDKVRVLPKNLEW